MDGPPTYPRNHGRRGTTEYPDLSPAGLLEVEVAEAVQDCGRGRPCLNFLDIPFKHLEAMLLAEADCDEGPECWPAWTDVPVEQLELDQLAEVDCDQDPECWPAWTDAPVEFVDYESFDDAGRLLQVQKGGA